MNSQYTINPDVKAKSIKRLEENAVGNTQGLE